MTSVGLDVDAVRARFPALRRGLAYFDGPGGTQVPQAVIDAIARYLREDNANLGGAFETSRRSDRLVADARLAAVGFLGCAPEEVVFGQNMTTLNLALSRSLGRELSEGDEIVCTRLDHDANVSPWLHLADDLGLTVRFAELTDECRIDLDDLRSKLSERTRVVAFPWASNAVGTVTEVERICALAHELLAGFVAAVDYLGALGWDAIAAYERELGERFLDGLPERWRLHGPPTMAGRVPTFALTAADVSPAEAAARLGERGIAAWHGNYYALEVMNALHLPDGALRVGIVHYNTADEVDRLLAELDRL